MRSVRGAFILCDWLTRSNLAAGPEYRRGRKHFAAEQSGGECVVRPPTQVHLPALLLQGFNLEVVVENEEVNLLPLMHNLPINPISIDLSHQNEKVDVVNDREVEFLHYSPMPVTDQKQIAACAANVESG